MIDKLLDIIQKLINVVDELKFFSKTSNKIDQNKIDDIESKIDEIKLYIENIKKES